MICGHEGQLIIEELLNDWKEGESEDNENNNTSNDDLMRKRSRQLAETKAVFAQLMAIWK